MKTHLPIFNGFYNTHFSPDDSINSYLESNDLEYDDIDFDIEGWKNRYSEILCLKIQNELKALNAVVKFEEVYTPDYYNFSNDSINCDITINTEKLTKFILSNQELYSDYIRNDCKSYDGFTSFYPNDFESWFNATNGFTQFDTFNGKSDKYILGYLLEIYLNDHDVTDFDIAECGNDLVECFIKVKSMKFGELNFIDKSIVLQYLLKKSTTEPFGYFEIIAKECKEIAKLIQMSNYFEIIVDKYPNEVKNHLKINDNTKINIKEINEVLKLEIGV